MRSLRRMTAFSGRCAVMLAIAAGLIASNVLLLDQGAIGLETWHAVMIGGVLAFLTIMSLVRRHAWWAALQLILGFWIALAPWLIDLGAGMAAPWLYGAAGLIVVVIASFEIYREFRRESETIEHMS